MNRWMRGWVDRDNEYIRVSCRSWVVGAWIFTVQLFHLFHLFANFHDKMLGGKKKSLLFYSGLRAVRSRVLINVYLWLT